MGRESVFDPRPYYPALALIRIPRAPNEREPAADAEEAEWGSAFFARTKGKQGLLLTARHNLIAGEGQPWVPKGELLPWVWVCCYDKSTGDWTDCYRVDFDHNLLITDESCDAALLQMSDYTPLRTLPLAYGVRRGDNVAIIGFQPKPGGGGTGFWPLSVTCYIASLPMDVQNIQGVQEPFLGLRFTPQAEASLPLAEGISGGPVMDLRYRPPHVVGVEKAIMPGGGLRPPYPLSIPLQQGFEPLFAKLPREYQPLIRESVFDITKRAAKQIWMSLGFPGKLIVSGIPVLVAVMFYLFSPSWISADKLACYIPYGFGGPDHPRTLEIELINSTGEAVINSSLVLACAALGSPLEVRVIGSAVEEPLDLNLEPGSQVSIPVALKRGEENVVRLEVISKGGWVGWDFWELKDNMNGSSIGLIGVKDGSYMEFKGVTGQQTLPKEYKLLCKVGEGPKGLELKCRRSRIEILLTGCK